MGPASPWLETRENWSAAGMAAGADPPLCLAGNYTSRVWEYASSSAQSPEDLALPGAPGSSSFSLKGEPRPAALPAAAPPPSPAQRRQGSLGWEQGAAPRRPQRTARRGSWAVDSHCPLWAPGQATPSTSPPPRALWPRRAKALGQLWERGCEGLHSCPLRLCMAEESALGPWRGRGAQPSGLFGDVQAGERGPGLKDVGGGRAGRPPGSGL